MSERKRKRGRPRVAPVLSYGNDIKMRSSISRKIQKPKYLLENDELEQSRESTPARSIDTDRSSTSGLGRNSRSYNPDPDSEYHYGSDFELDEDSDHDDKNSYSSKLSSRPSSDLEESDLELDFNHGDSMNDDHTWKQDHMQRNSSPQLVWLQDRAFPKLTIPKSSDDLLIPKHQTLKAVGIYEILRHFHVMARLSPFRFEDFCAALISDELNVLMTDIHIALLKALVREDDSQQTHFGPLDQKDSTNVYLYFIDTLTWPENLKLYLQSDKDFSKCLKILESTDYPMTSLDNKLVVLQFLCDQFLQTSNVREDLLNEGKVRYDDHCRVCHKTGDLLCCDSCSAVYHLDCADPPLKEAPSELEDWTCKVCKSHELMGVTDCVSPMELSGVLSRQDPLGYDRHGRKYWFLCRRIFVEAVDGEVWYYSTVDQFEYLISVIDASDLEEALHVAFHEFGEDIRRQMLITEKLTDKARGNNLTCLMTDREIATKAHEEFRVKKEDDSNNGDSNLEMNPVTGEIFSREDANDVKSEEFVVPDEYESLSLANVKKSQLSILNGKAPPKLKEDISFRLGCDHSYKNYVNQYTTNTLALNKLQHNEERDKKRHLNHKVSLNAPVDFKWVGPTTGNSDNLMSTVRQTLLSLEQNISGHFLHSHWHLARKSWQQNTLNAAKPQHLAKALRWLTICIKPIVYCPIWNDSIGHVRLKKITAMDREERKKQEKRDKKEADEESRLYPSVRYRKQFSHQLWKIKGEEYRIHGLWGWQWLSAHRKCLQTSMSTCGMRAGPEKISIPVKTGNQSGSEMRGLPITVVAFRQLANKNSKLQHSILPAREQKMNLEDTAETKSELIIYNQGNKQKVEVIPINLEDHLEEGVVNVSKALSCENRFVYPKLCKASSLDSLLAKREAHHKAELQEVEAQEAEETDSDATLSDGADHDTDSAWTAKSPIADSKPTGHILKEMRLYKLKYEELDKHDDTLSCYSPSCKGSGRSTCYSPLCILKEKTKQKLISRVNDYKIASGKSAPFNQAGTNFPIKFEDLKPENKNPSKKSKSPVKGAPKSRKMCNTDDTRQKVTLKIPSEAKPRPLSRLPTPCRYKYASLGSPDKPQRYSPLVLPQYELKILARRAGFFNVSGFLHNAKSNSSAWPYPCSRPSFKVMWQYRSNILNSITATALQLRILWSCLRWEDMSEKPPLDGRKQITTETEMITTQILKRRTFGRFLHKTQYLLRKVVIPLDVPKQMREFTPSQRSGLRKRRRAVSPVNKEPESAEIWVDEEKLCLWEVKFFGDRLEKATLMSKKNTQLEKCNDTPTVSRSSSPAELKAKLEEQLKIQRTNFNQKKAMENNGTVVKMVGSPLGAGTGTLNSIKTLSGSPSVVTLGGSIPGMMAGRKIMTTRGGKIITVQANSNEATKKLTLGASPVFPVQKPGSTASKVLKIQSLPGVRQRTILPRATAPSTPIQFSHNVVKQSPTSVPIIRTSPAGQQIQIVKLPDGQIQVKGLQDGQKVLQRGDGKLQLISKPSISGPTPITLAQSPTKENIAQIKSVAGLGGNQIVKINGQPVIMRTNQNNRQVINMNQIGGATPTVKTTQAKGNNVLSVKTLAKNSQVVNQKTEGTDQPSPTITLRVQVKMTDQGPKTIIQGLTPGIGLTKDHIMAIQQQVKNMLSTKTLQVNELSPLLTLQLSVPNSNAAAPARGPKPVEPSPRNTTNKTISTGRTNHNMNDGTKAIKTGLSHGNMTSVTGEKLMELQKFTTEKSDAGALTTNSDSAPVGKPSTKRGREQEDLDYDAEDGTVPKSKTKRARSEKQSKGKREPSASPSKAVLQDAKKKQAKMQKLEGFLSKHKELLKKDILKKRAHLEKELQLMIHKELAVAKRQVNLLDRVKPLETPPVNNRKRSHSQISSPDHANRNQHNRKDSQTSPVPHKQSPKVTSATKTKKVSKSKTKKIVCICRTAFDDTKFYVGCDLCGNWFHGDCIGISEASSRNMTEYVCDDCANAKLNKELFCFCRQPYDESQFYICCERCNDWYHGKCIGIMQIEADDIDDYICPKCDNSNEWNYPCQKKMTAKDYSELKKVAKAVVQHKNAWPFLEAVDPSEVPDYYKVVKAPMDLRTIEENVNSHKYKTLCEFVGHVMLVFDNCRAYNPPNSSFCSCASTLENFFCGRLRQLKLKIGGKI